MSTRPTREIVPAVVSSGFTASIAMWTVGYFARMPGIQLSGPVVLALLVVCLAAVGITMRRRGLGWPAAAAAGAVSGLVNLFVLAGILSDVTGAEQWRSAALWVPGSIVAAAAVSALAAAAVSSPERCPSTPWLAWFARAAVVATLVMIAIGGIVTSADAGLAVVDWPNSYGYNMFLFPFSKMTGGIYYEHAHRLFGALVGLTTVALALMLQTRDPRPVVRGIGWLAVALVVLQGVLGGLRVTGVLTMSDSPEVMRPSLGLAMVHGVLGQVFLGTLAVLAAVTSPTWKALPATSAAPRGLSVGLLPALLAQLMLGAAQRHFDGFVLAHVLFGLIVVAPLATHVGMRAWSTASAPRFVRGFGFWLALVVFAQVGLGIAAWIGTAMESAGRAPTAALALTALHQWTGALLLLLAVLVACWAGRTSVENRTFRLTEDFGAEARWKSGPKPV